MIKCPKCDGEAGRMGCGAYVDAFGLQEYYKWTPDTYQCKKCKFTDKLDSFSSWKPKKAIRTKEQ